MKPGMSDLCNHTVYNTQSTKPLPLSSITSNCLVFSKILKCWQRQTSQLTSRGPNTSVYQYKKVNLFSLGGKIFTENARHIRTRRLYAWWIIFCHLSADLGNWRRNGALLFTIKTFPLVILPEKCVLSDGPYGPIQTLFVISVQCRGDWSFVSKNWKMK